ncbi:hypothetical protein M8C21_012669 [Ambrosia artemisiifolia]|uniref:Uncharacterized protein n=1 Tax=Ambrosia artemisiifolia TaxID=4212 RepID=A0AAD5CRL8_AMBAR|nr:hypothetical protein M8C21_012669 [Ambrosia artemisiifolia]
MRYEECNQFEAETTVARNVCLHQFLKELGLWIAEQQQQHRVKNGADERHAEDACGLHGIFSSKTINFSRF